MFYVVSVCINKHSAAILPNLQQTPKKLKPFQNTPTY